MFKKKEREGRLNGLKACILSGGDGGQKVGCMQAGEKEHFLSCKLWGII